MAPKSISLIFTILSVMTVLAPNEASRGGPIVGGWKPIKNLADTQVVDIANFAVREHNKQANTSLSFVAVVKGETQVVSGMNYRLVIAANDGGDAAVVKSKNYSAFVYCPLKNPKQLVSFEKN